MTARLPTNEQDRLEALRAHDVMDTAPEAEFDDLVEVASRVFGVPIALVTLVDEERQWSGVDTTPGICPECSEGLVAHDGE